jgi:hypothetical protein
MLRGRLGCIHRREPAEDEESARRHIIALGTKDPVVIQHLVNPRPQVPLRPLGPAQSVSRTRDNLEEHTLGV